MMLPCLNIQYKGSINFRYQDNIWENHSKKDLRLSISKSI